MLAVAFKANGEIPFAPNFGIAVHRAPVNSIYHNLHATINREASVSTRLHGLREHTGDFGAKVSMQT